MKSRREKSEDLTPSLYLQRTTVALLASNSFLLLIVVAQLALISYDFRMRYTGEKLEDFGGKLEPNDKIPVLKSKILKRSVNFDPSIDTVGNSTKSQNRSEESNSESKTQVPTLDPRDPEWIVQMFKAFAGFFSEAKTIFESHDSAITSGTYASNMEPMELEANVSIALSAIENSLRNARNVSGTDEADNFVGPYVDSRSLTPLVYRIMTTLDRIKDHLVLQDFKNPNQSCPHRNSGGYQLVGPPAYWSSCYYLSEEIYTFDRAQRHCRLIGGRLVELRSKEEIEFLTKFIINKQANEQAILEGKMDFLIGGRRNAAGGTYSWIDSGTEVSSSNWKSAETNPKKECMILQNGKWVSSDCKRKTRFLCQAESKIENVKSPPVQEDVPRVASQTKSSITNSTYLYVVENYPWTKAQIFCEERGGSLAKIESATENAEIWHHIAHGRFSRPNYRSERKWWIGARQSDTDWAWVNTNHSFDGGFTDWKPNLKPKRFGCLLITLDQKDGYSWEQAGCHDWHYFICEIPPNDKNTVQTDVKIDFDKCMERKYTTGRFVTTVKNCYTFVQLQLQKEEAEAYCKNKLGKTLAQIENGQKTMFYDFIKTFSEGRQMAYWWLKYNRPVIPKELHGIVRRKQIPVCGKGWSQTDAKVYCREMGFSDARSASQRNEPFNNFRELSMYDVSCVGDEASLDDCIHATTGNCHDDFFNSANVAYVAYVECVDEPFAKPCTWYSSNALERQVRERYTDCSNFAWFVCEAPPLVVHQR